MSKFKKGLKVFHLMYGVGTVQQTSADHKRINVVFDNDIKIFLSCGKCFETDMYPSLFLYEEAVERFGDIIKIKKTVYCNIYFRKDKTLGSSYMYEKESDAHDMFDDEWEDGTSYKAIPLTVEV